MNELLELNKEDIIKNWLWIGGIMTFGFSIYYFFFHKELKTELYISVAVLSIVFFPLITIGIWSYDWFKKRKYKKRILTKNPFSELEKIGFTKRIVKRNHNSLKDYVQYAEINGCEMIFDLDGGYNVQVTQTALNSDDQTTSSGSFNYNIEDHTIGFNGGVELLFGGDYYGDVSNWTSVKVIEISENSLRLAVVRDQSRSGEEVAQIVFHYKPKE